MAVKGPKGELRRTLHEEMELALDDGSVHRGPSQRRAEAQGAPRAHPHAGAEHGGRRVQGLQQDAGDPGRRLQGRGQAVRRQPDRRVTRIRSSTRRPKGIKISVDNNTIVKIEGADKELVGQVAAELRSVRPPEPYKGKGIRYLGEQVRRKAGKTGAK